MSSRVLVALRVKATPERAFAVFTAEIGQWWRPNGYSFDFTPRSPGVIVVRAGPGAAGRLIETLPNGKMFEVGKIRVWEPPHRLVFGWRQAAFTPDQDTQVEIRFEDVGDETRITVVHTGWDSVPAKHVARHGFPDPIFLQRHAEWWQSLLGSFKSAPAGGRVVTDFLGLEAEITTTAPSHWLGSAAFGFIFATSTMNAISFGLMIPVLPYLVQSFVGGDTGAGRDLDAMVFGAHLGLRCSSFGDRCWGSLSDRFGRRPVLLILDFRPGLRLPVHGVRADHLVAAGGTRD